MSQYLHKCHKCQSYKNLHDYQSNLFCCLSLSFGDMDLSTIRTVLAHCLIHSFLISAILAYVSPIMAIRRFRRRITNSDMKINQWNLAIMQVTILACLLWNNNLQFNLWYCVWFHQMYPIDLQILQETL